MAPHLKTQNKNPTQSKPKRRKRRETTISASANPPETTAPPAVEPSLPTHRKREPPAVATDGAWCCAAKPAATPSPPPQRKTNTTTTTNVPHLPLEPEQPDPVVSPENNRPAGDILRTGEVSALIKQGFIPDKASSPFKIRVSPGRVSPVMDSAFASSYPSSYNKFNTALNAGLLNPMSPPPPMEKTRSSPTLFEMMASEQECHPKQQVPSTVQLVGKPPITNQEKQLILQEKVAEILGSCSPGNQFNDPTSSDVKLTLCSKDGFSVSLNVHRHILVAHSRFFAAKLSDRWSKQQRSLPHLVEISDCDDVEIYMETLRLMYCKDLRRKLMKEDVPKVLGILKVSAAIVFDAGVLSCLEYLEAAPWAEDEEEKVASLLSQLQLESVGAGEVLKRVSVEVSEMEEGCEAVLVKLLQVVLDGKDEKARREMKGLVSKMLRENAAQNVNLSDLSKDSLYSACDGCLKLLHHHFLRVAASDFTENQAAEQRAMAVGQISRQADNLHWILDILIDRKIADEFAKIWANQAQLAELHSRVPTMYRFEVSRLTARFCVGIGKGQILISKEVRCLLLQTWLEPLYDDFGWMRRAGKGLDRNLVEDGLSQTILTLPLSQQQTILLNWFDRFLNSGDDCPNIQRAFEVWWRRAFWKRNCESEGPEVQVATCDNSR